MNKGNSLTNRLVALMLSIVMVLGMVPTSVFAVEPTSAYGTVESFTDGVAINSTGAEVKATYGGTLNWIAKDESVGRMSDGWWVGLKVTAPETIDMETAKYTSGGEAKLFKDYNDSADDAQVQWIGLWGLVKEEYLRSAGQTDGLSTYTWTFDWNGDGTFEQTIVLDIEAARTVLLNGESQQVYPAAPIGNGDVAGITAGSSIAVNGSTTTVTYSDITLDWVAADPAAGRNQDGWWVGMKITAPAALTVEGDFTNVTYQSYGSNGWSAAKSFWNAQDSDKAVADTARYLTMWGMISPELIANDQDKVLTYQYRFDWNGDGIYEQNLVLKINAITVTLMKNGIQQLPLQYGVAEAITEGTVTGSETADSVITYENITLNWSAAAPALGRNQDGWWVGAKITAPAGMTTEAVCGNIKYQRYENGAWSAAKSFWNAQDSDKNAADTARYLTMWCLVTPELIANDNDGILTLPYRFDWNQDGEYEQQLTMKVDAGKVTLLNENNVQVYPTLGEVTPLTNGTVTGSGTGETSVLIKDVTIAWSEADATIGRVQDGWWTGMKVTAPSGVEIENVKYRRKNGAGWTDPMSYVPDEGTTLQLWGLVTAEYLDTFIGYGRNMNYTWQFDWNGDGTFEQTVTMSIDPANITLKQAGFDFSVDTDTITYGHNNNVYTILAPTGGQAGNLAYSVNDPTVATVNTDGTLTILKAGTVEITATLSGTHYEDITATYTLTVEKADQPDFGFDNPPATVTWQQDLWSAPALKNGLGEGALTWSVKGNSDVATVDSATGKITLLKAGTFTLQVQKAGDDCYNASAVVETEIEVLLKDQSNFGFGETESVTVTYNDNNNQYTLAATGGQSTGGVTYAVVEGDAATVNEATGVVTILKAGTVVIKATKAADHQYKEASDTYELIVEKADQSFTFDHAAAITETYGLTAFETKINPCALNSGVVTYAISENTIGASVDANGLVTFANSTGKVGTATVTVTMVADDCYNAFTDTYTITLAYEATPGTAYELDGNKILTGSGWFTGDVKIKAPAGYEISYSNDLTGNQWADHVLWTTDGQEGTWAAAPVVYLKNANGITDAISVPDLKKDTVKPNGLEISYDVSLWAKIGEMFGFNASTVEVTVSAADAMSGIGKMEYSLDQGQNYTEITPVGGKYTFSVAPQYRGQLYLRATDIAGNAEVYAHAGDGSNKILVVDHTAPGLEVTYAGGMDDTATDGIRYVKGDKITAMFTITDENFDLRGAEPVVKVNGNPVSGWVCNATTGTLTFDLTAEGDYAIEASFADRLGREVTYAAEIRIDRTKPTVESTIVDGKYYAQNQEVVLTVTEHNFDASKVNLAISAVDSQGNAVLTAEQMQKFADDAKNPANWVSQGDAHKLTLEITVDGNYTLTASATDVLGWTSDNYRTTFTVDKLAPVDLQISYSEPVTTLWEDILQAITFGAYNPTANKPLTVTLTASDAVAGVEYFEWFYTREPGASQANAASGSVNKLDVAQRQENSAVSSVTFEVAPQARGYISFRATDRSGNTYGKDPSGATADRWVVDSGRINIVDTIAPQREVSFTPTNVVDIATMKDTTQWNEDSAVVLYYNTDAVATFKVTETNFYAEDVKVFVNGAETQLDKADWTVGGADNVWTNTLTLVEEGDYVISMTYTDRSSNQMEVYTSQRIVIDKTKPEIEVKYGNTDVKNTIGGRKYFSKAQSATITIEEHNFRAEDVVIKVTATDVLGNAVLRLNNDGTVKAYADQGANKANWTAFEEGTWRVADDAYILDLNFTADANYTFDIEYQDLAKNAAVDYTADQFTVDTTAPKNLTVDYSTSVLEQIKESITFGYYNAMMTVTITAEDDTSGIYHFAYSYIKGKDVSGVNAELLEQAIREADVDYDGKKATATFNIPKMVLGADNQFNGTVEFVAYDRSEISSQLKDTTVIVVDNITPTSQITYNAPVQTSDNISYYDGNINATIAINEANFDAGDVVVTVTKDGENFPVNVTWTDESVDAHTGAFTLTSDGDYIVSVQYKDKSGNTMAAYQSNQLTLDATKPTIQVSNIKANSANKDETYGFVITINDTNLDASSLKPVLQAVVEKEEGIYVTQEIDLGTARTVVAGQTYTYTVENLPQDGLYTLTCNVKDMSGNPMSRIGLADGQSYEQVQFSINRKGSTFGYGNKFTSDLVGQYYIHSVLEDVVIVEVNVDPIEHYTVSLNGKELVEGTDYTSIQTSKDGQWSKRTYTLKKDLFAQEGEYSIIVSSVDKTETTAFSDVKNLSLSFVVDQTAPVLTITGLEAGGRYQTDAQTVTLIPTDEGGRLNSLRVLVLDSSGNPLKSESGEDISVRFDMSGEELLKYLEDNDGKITFTIPEGLNNQVKIICNDCAVNADDLTNEYNELFQRVTVSQNQLVIFYANTPLFVGSIVGVLAVAGLIIFLIKRKGSKKDKTAAKA